MKKIILMALLLTGCANQATHLQTLENTISAIDTARQTIAPIVSSDCSIINDVNIFIDPSLKATTTAICTLLNSANSAFNNMPKATDVKK